MFKLKQIYIKAKFLGLNYQCPFCQSRLKRLKPFGLKFPVLVEKNVIGGGYRLNALCPVCNSLDRERLLYLYLLNKTNVFTDKLKLLHIAPEAGLSRVIKKHSNIDYLTSDINSNTVMVKMDITKIDLPDNSFDVIICNHVLEHIIDDKKAMHELHRVLKLGGWGILQVPISLSISKTFEDSSVVIPEKREEVFGQSDHVRIYALDYVDRLEESGFNVAQFKWWEDEQFGPPKNKFGLIQDETLFIVTKPYN